MDRRMRKTNPNSFRQKILREWDKTKNIDKVLEVFKADKYPNIKFIILITLRDKMEEYKVV